MRSKKAFENDLKVHPRTCCRARTLLAGRARLLPGLRYWWLVAVGMVKFATPPSWRCCVGGILIHSSFGRRDVTAHMCAETFATEEVQEPSCDYSGSQ